MASPRDTGGVRAALIDNIIRGVLTEVEGIELLLRNNTTIQFRFTEDGKMPRYFTVTVRENV